MSWPENTEYSYEPQERDYTPEHLESDLDQTREMLLTWHSCRELQGIFTHQTLSEQFKQAEQGLERIVKAAPFVGKSLRLITGHKEIFACTFEKLPYHIHDAQSDELQPASSIDIIHAIAFPDSHHPDRPKPDDSYSRKELYIGDDQVLVATATLAKTLHEGGQLTLVEKSEEP